MLSPAESSFSLAALGVCCRTQAFSSCEQRLPSSWGVRASHRAASLVAGHGLSFHGLSRCGARAYCSTAHGISPDPGSHPRPLHCMQILSHWTPGEQPLLSLCHQHFQAPFTSGSHLESGGAMVFDTRVLLCANWSKSCPPVPASLCRAVGASPLPLEKKASGHFQKKANQVADGCRGGGCFECPTLD